MTDDLTPDRPTRYFGPSVLMKTDGSETPVPTPVGETCLLCQEQVAAGDMGTIDWADRIIHYECMLRVVVGSVGHQRRRCSCYGGDEEDPPGMTPRQAAVAATILYEANH